MTLVYLHLAGSLVCLCVMAWIGSAIYLDARDRRMKRGNDG